MIDWAGVSSWCRFTPGRTDVVVIGSGYTGLAAALGLARGGRRVLLLEAREFGHGCSTRNGGQVSSGMKPSLAALTKRYGEARAKAVLGTGVAAHRFLGDFLTREGLACDYEPAVGHFIGAHRSDCYEELAGYVAEQNALGVAAHMVPKAEQRAYSEGFAAHGGVFLPGWSSIHPGKYQRKLFALAAAAGVEMLAHTPATSVEESGGEALVRSGRAMIRARDVVVGVDGYTSFGRGEAFGWIRRQTIPIGSFVMVTEPLDTATIQRLIQLRSMLYDTRKRMSHTRPTPDGQRILFGTRVSLDESQPRLSLPAAYANMVRFFPELDGTRISRLWFGKVGYTFDELPHIGSRGRVHFGTGYCGTGIAMATYLGRALAGRILGERAPTGLDSEPLRTAPLYTGAPWFLPALLAWYGCKDKWPH
jgi:glycine/D-amino acid oxidase-like deaminating enzyme